MEHRLSYACVARRVGEARLAILCSLLAAEAQLAETQRQLAAGRKALAGYAELLREAQLREQQQAAIDQAEDAKYEVEVKAAGRSCGLSDADLDWLRR